MESKKMYEWIQNMRIKNLEEQIYLMSREVQRLREGMLQQDDVVKLSQFMTKLKELNSILVQLRHHYQCLRQSMRHQTKRTWHTEAPKIRNCYMVRQKDTSDEEGLGRAITVSKDGTIKRNAHQPRELPRAKAGCSAAESDPETSTAKKSSKKKTDTNGTGEAATGTLDSCKNLLDHNKRPSSILGNYLMRLQDFRADPELRRKRLERKHQERLLELQKQEPIIKTTVDKTTLTDASEPSNPSAAPKSSSHFTGCQPQGAKLLGKEAGHTSGSENVETDSDWSFTNLPIVKNNLSKVIDEIVADIDRKTVALTIVAENDFAYYVSVSQIADGQTMSSFLATDDAIEEAKGQRLFQDVLTLFVVNAENSKRQKERILGHVFEFF